MRVEDDLATRVANGKPMDDYILSRAARFSLYQDPKDTPFFNTKDSFVKSSKGTFLDRIMAEIPGKQCLIYHSYNVDIFSVTILVTSFWSS